MSILLAPRDVEIRHFHLFAGLGGGARGFNQGKARLGSVEARFRCIGGVDVDRAAVADFEQLAGARGTHLDLFSRDQYETFHGAPPADDWREATPDDIRRAAGGERPHIVFGSAPCKGFSGLLSQSRSASAKYQALNQLALRGLWLALEAWGDDPPEFFLWENVPRIATRGRQVLDQVVALLAHYGYATAETTHDCGVLGNLAQSRKRFLLVARHRAKVPPFLYEPPRRPLRAVGEVLGRMPLPGDEAAGPMHRMRTLQWKTWVRLAFVEAGGDWRSLNRLRVVDGRLADYAIVPEAAEYFPNVLGVQPWNEPACTVTTRSAPSNGRFSVADPRLFGWGEYSQFGVMGWDETAGTVSGQSAAGGGRYSVADPRCAWHPAAMRNKLKVTPWNAPSGTVIGAQQVARGGGSVADPRLGSTGPRFNNVFKVVRWDAAAAAVTGPGGAGGQAVADPRSGSGWTGKGKYRVTAFDEPAGAVIGASTTGSGACAVADPRASNYGVVPWDAPAGTITGGASADSGRFSVADPRLPEPGLQLVAVIRALDGTWHRPFTTLELAALQGLIDPEEPLVLTGKSDSAWRERIGNAVPPPTAASVASVMGTTLLLAWAGETFALSTQPIWVRQIAVGLSVAQEEVQ